MAPVLLPLRSSAPNALAADLLAEWQQIQFVNQYAENLDRIILVVPPGSGSLYSVAVVPVEASKPALKQWKLQAIPCESASGLIAEIRAALSLQIKELAAILDVERPTIYAWIKGAAPQQANLKRLNQIRQIARSWNRLSDYPLGKAIRDLDEKGLSILDCLSQETIPEEEVLGRFQAIAPTIQPPNLGKKSIRQIARERGIDLSKIKPRDDEFDVLTGKRISLE